MVTAHDALISEADFQQQIVDLMAITGWKHLHVRRTRGKQSKWVTSTNRSGWPDLFCWHPEGGIFAAELKSQVGTLRDDQKVVLDELTAAGVECHVWRPSDWPEIQARLTRPRRAP